jgi:integrase/recombinase XerC
MLPLPSNLLFRLEQIDPILPSGCRDVVLVRSLWELQRTRTQLCRLNVGDYDPEGRHLAGQSLSPELGAALDQWLQHYRTWDPCTPDAPLFVALDRAHFGHRLTATAIYRIVTKICGRSPAALLQASYPPARQSMPSAPPVPAAPNLIANLLANKRSPNTKRAYEKDLQDFFYFAYQGVADPHHLADFLQADRYQAIARVFAYKAHLIARGLSEATINRRLSSLRALVAHAGKVGMCSWNLAAIDTEKVHSYRDTSGVPPEKIKLLFGALDRHTPRSKRDYAILRLLWENGLRRHEVVGCNTSDFTPGDRTLRILGKGRGSQKQILSLSDATTQALGDWLTHRPIASEPLFIALDAVHLGHRLTGTALYLIVRNLARRAGIDKPLSPHRIRHAAITAALDATGGNVRKVQKFSRHQRLDTLLIYDDNRSNMQGEVSGILSNLL